MPSAINTLNREPQPLPAWRRFGLELVLFGSALALMAFGLALFSYTPDDPAWSTSGRHTHTANWLGALGAWLADIAYYLMGASVWVIGAAWVRTWLAELARWLRRTDSQAEKKHGQATPRTMRWRLGLAWVGLLVACAVLEWSRLHRFDGALPAGAGGVLGQMVGPWVVAALGFDGSAVAMAVVLVSSLPPVFGFSWVIWAETVGAWIDTRIMALRQRRAQVEDLRIGERAAKAREEVVEAERVEQRQHPPVTVRIEPYLDGVEPLEPESAATPKPSVNTADDPPAWEPVTTGRPMPRTSGRAGEGGPMPPAEATVHGAGAGAPTHGAPVAWPEHSAVRAAPRESQAPEHRAKTGTAWADTQPHADEQFEAVSLPQGLASPWASGMTASVFKEATSRPMPSQPTATKTAGPPAFTVPMPSPRGDAPESTPSTVSAVATPAPSPSTALGHNVAAPSGPSVTSPEPPRAMPAAALAVATSPKASFEGRALVGTERPTVALLDAPPTVGHGVDRAALDMTSRLIEKKLKDFGVQVTVIAAIPGPVITRYEIEPATGVKGVQIVNLAKDLARSLSLVSIRVVETIPGKNLMALELPNAKRQTIRLSEVLGAPVYQEAPSLLTMGLGKDIGGQPVVADLAKMPHCLVAGTTGSGKSVGINAMILSLLYKAEPKDVRLLLIDPKMLEMSVYEGIPHLLAPVVTDMKHAANGLNWCVAEMEKRYKLMSKLGVRNLAGFNAKIEEARARGDIIGNPFSLTPEQPEPLERLPYLVVVIDELADLMMVVGKKIEELIARLAQKARAAGIHLILATQRPSVDVITGLIKANIPTRMAFQVSSKIDSRTILDQMGAETLLGMGDMLYMPAGTGYPMRVHGAFVSDDEVHRVVAHLKAHGGEPDYIDGVLESTLDEATEQGGGEGDGDGSEKDPLYDQAVEIVLKDRKASISYVQRKLKIGYNRAARLLEDMEHAGLVSSLTSSGQRDILVPARAE